jgi:hypothetical protein
MISFIRDFRDLLNKRLQLTRAAQPKSYNSNLLLLILLTFINKGSAEEIKALLLRLRDTKVRMRRSIIISARTSNLDIATIFCSYR